MGKEALTKMSTYQRALLYHPHHPAAFRALLSQHEKEQKALEKKQREASRHKDAR